MVIERRGRGRKAGLMGGCECDVMGGDADGGDDRASEEEGEGKRGEGKYIEMCIIVHIVRMPAPV